MFGKFLHVVVTDLLYYVVTIEHLRREAVVASSRLTYKLMDTLNNG